MGMIHRTTASGAGVSNPAASAETVIYTTPAISAGQQVQNPGNPVSITGTVNITPGTSTTGITIRIRQGSLTGPVIGVAPLHTVVAGAPQSISFGGTDATTFLESPNSYVITAQQTAGTVAGTTNMVDVEVLV